MSGSQYLYDLGYVYALNVENLRTLGNNTEDINGKTFTVYSVWSNSQVIIKINLGATGEYKYFGDDGVLNVFYDTSLASKCFLITGMVLNETFYIPKLEDIYSFGKVAISYFNRVDNRTINNGTISLLKDICTNNNDGSYTFTLDVVWREAVCYIDNYYAMKSGCERFFYTFADALNAMQNDTDIATKSESIPYTKIVILKRTNYFSIQNQINITSKLILSLYDKAEHSDLIVNDAFSLLRATDFSGDYVFNISSTGTLEFEESENGVFLLDGTSISPVNSFIKVDGGILYLCDGLVISGNNNSLSTFGGAIYAVNNAKIII
ncbi:MAG: hypothetical protein EOM05_10895, partial [Clostridia bacterium]|nr:hypothetical protein [Clostridia bacterium]